MAYAAAIYVQDSINQLTHLSDRFANISRPPVYISDLTSQMADSLQTIDFEENDAEGKYLEKEIKNALWKAEKIIDSYMLSRLLSPEDMNENSGDMSLALNFSEELQEVSREIESTKERLDRLADDLKHRKVMLFLREIMGSHMFSHLIPSTHLIQLTDDLPPVHKNKMVGLDRELQQMKEVILEEYCQHHCLGAFVICGMAGIGKTSLVISIYNDLEVRSHFSIGAWIKISHEHSARNILHNLLNTMKSFDGRKLEDIIKFMKTEHMDDEHLANFVRPFFMGQRYLVIVDCLCDINLESWDYIKTILLDSNNGSRILLVTRSEFNSDSEFILGSYRKGFLDESQSWNLLRQQVFGYKECPKPLEEIGEKISKKCQGLPLAIITVGTHLAKKEKTKEYWNKVAESGNSVAYAEDGAPMLEQIGLSYNQISHTFRHVFLYMAVFQERQEISVLELQRLWAADGLLCKEDGVLEYFLDKNLIIDNVKINSEMYWWSLHHALWYFCCSQAKKEEFFHVFNDDSNTNSKLRRLVIRKTVLFAIYELVDKIEHSVLSIRSMLFTGPYHPYPLTAISWSNYKMLKVLSACSIRFYEFPDEVLYLKLLRYLSLTLNNGDLPHGISKLRNLESLIVRLHQIVRSYKGRPLYLPMEIWEMQKLVHLQVMGYDLPVPPQNSDAVLPELKILLGVTPCSCTKEVLKRTPKLININIRTNLEPERNSPPICLFDHNVLLKDLHSASFVITNPHFEEFTGPQVVATPESFSFSMKNLKSISFSGCGLAWESIEPISHLRFLLELELRSNAFRGPKWEIKSTGFNQLQLLHLEDLDLMYWTSRSEDHFFPRLCRVTITNCHKLEKISPGFVHCPDIIEIQVLDSSFEAENWARRLSEILEVTPRITSQRTQPINTK